MTRRRPNPILAFLLGALVVASGLTAFQIAVAPAPSAQAITGSDFQPGNIISDQKFFNGSALDANSVQAFLNSKVSECRSGYTCLKDYRQTTWTRAADPMCGQYSGAANESAAQIITKVGNACGVSQMVLLVLLQKEQSLVTDSWPGPGQYESATGFACPDTAPCDAEYAGFYNQVYKAAWQYKRYTNPAGTSNFFNWFPVGSYSAVRYHPNAACGSSSVLIQNKATAALYYYTPYQPNAVALSNLYGGQTDGCSSYGNRNFWRLYTDWFGSTTGGVVPIGGMNVVNLSTGDVEVQGWAIDRDTKDAVAIHVYMDGGILATGVANASRPDVGAAYPGFGDNHGIKIKVSPPSGSHNFCAWAINDTPGANTLLGCQTLTVTNLSPFGGMNAFSTQFSGKITVNGWTIDPETKDPIAVHVYVDGAPVAAITADANRPDVGRAYPSAGPRHGIDYTFEASPGSHNVCAYGINVKNGTNSGLGCQTVFVDDMSPFGGMDVTVDGTDLVVRGWTIDPETTSAIPVHIYMDGQAVAVTTANVDRPDVARAFPGYGSKHGINVRFTPSVGTHQVCAYGINTGRGTNNLLGCQTVTVRNVSPIGGMDARVEGGRIIVNGWTIDPDTTAPLAVHVYVNGVGAAITTADFSRPDVGRAYPDFGPNHGINVSTPAVRGANSVCAYGINVGPGTNTLLGCQTVTY
ncbi:hypothetical protein ACEXQB_013945 [Herbiconiux sp. P18]|uniref:hypothetical protein n=1 Tax=Herbiconiux liangxiaofengii TaxID=3342795 RepID=UPI0035BA5CFB